MSTDTTAIDPIDPITYPIPQDELVVTPINPPTAEVPNELPPHTDTADFTLDDVFNDNSAAEEVIADQAAKEEEIAPLSHVGKPNALHDYPVSFEKGKGSPDVLNIPPATDADIQSRLDQAPNIDIMIGEKQQLWAATLRGSLPMLPRRGVFTDRLNTPGAAFAQSLKYNGVELRGQAPSFKSVPGTKEVEGERALLQLVTHMGVGGLFRAPMWNSGFWVMFKPATESELLELNRILTSNKIGLGRWSYGLALSSSVVYTLDHVLDFIVRHVYNTSVKPEELPIQNVRDYLAPQDVMSFIWGFLCANYPNGFQYRTGCIENPAKCSHVVEATLNLTKLQNTDFSVLTEWQRQHMASMAANTKTLASVKRYREEMKLLQNRRIVINETTQHEIAITIRTPTLTQYVDQGHRWIGGIVDGVTRALGEAATETERAALVTRYGKATTLCQYSHWIESIEYGDLSGDELGAETRAINKVTDPATIEDSLRQLSATDSLRERIIDEVLKYINDSTISVIGVPAYNCPACGKPQDAEPVYPRHVSVIPLDMLQVFFALLSQRLERIELR